jgi:dephospho-CoA kinase
VIDADAIGHELLRQRSPCYPRVVKAFGPSIVKTGGEIDRGAMGGIVFADKRSMRILNGIVHPVLIEHIEAKIAEHKSGVVVIDAALIAQWGMEKSLDHLIMVDAPVKARLARLAAKGVPAGTARRMMRSQLPVSRLKRAADMLLDNRGDRRCLEQHARLVWQWLSEHGHDTNPL